MRRFSVVSALAIFLLLPTSVAAAECQFVLGFKTIRDLIGHETVGECLENQHHGANGDGLQQTTGGLMVWRKADNWTAFTDGYRTWVNGPYGLQERLNTQRYDWEAGHSPLTSVIPSTRYSGPAHPNARFLIDLAEAAPWYQDGLDRDHPSFPEPRAVWALQKIDRNNPHLVNVMSRWAWLFDEDMRTDEVSVLEYIASLDTDLPELAAHLASLPWIQDGITPWETRAASSVYGAARHYDLDFALQLATAPWVVDGVSALEAYEGAHSLSEMTGNSEMAHASPDLGRKVMSFVSYPPKETDFYLIKGLQTIHWLNPDGFKRLLAEPWFVDGLNEKERIYLIAAGGSDLSEDQLFAPYHVGSGKITLPHSGEVNVWIVRRQPFLPGDDAIANLAEAVRASEQFFGLPFPVDHVILSLLVEGGRGIHLGHMMVLTPFDGQLSLPPYHEVAHYYFNDGPTWYLEGGAEFIAHYYHNGEKLPTVDFPEYCREQEVHNLQALNALGDLGGGDVWDRCRYDMGLHFLVNLREAMGDDPWRAALRTLFLKGGYEGLYLASGGATDEEVYQVFLEHTPPHLVAAVKDVFRGLHGGPFVD